jgi:protein Tex
VDVMRYFDAAIPSQQQPWIVALGNGHGTQEAQRLAKEALEEIKKPSVGIRLVDEAGASVWSVTAAAAKEYPAQPASALAAISIGRRLLNPLDELVKIPPKSLGLGMYQHDHSEKALEERLDAASIDAVAEVGVDGNSCSLEILEKVPGLSHRLAERIVQKRPLRQRDDLLAVSGIGPAVFQSCAAFIRVNGGSEPLDGTLCHPESYDVAKWALKTLKWKLSDPLSVAAVPSDAAKRRVEWKNILVAAAAKFHIPEERVYSILVQLVHSIEKKDPRLVPHESRSSSSTTTESAAMLDQLEEEQGSPLPPHLSSLDKLKKACPVRSIKGTIRNVVDFGAFIDIGAESDGLLHCSKLGPALKLSSFQIGQSLIVDVLSVENQRISLAIPGVASRLSQDDPVAWNGAKRRRNDDAEASAPPKKQKQSRKR